MSISDEYFVGSSIDNVDTRAIMDFSKDKHEKFCRCPKCYSETKHRKLRDDELDFGEVLDKEMHKRK